jgi:hypothetical protein
MPTILNITLIAEMVHEARAAKGFFDRVFGRFAAIDVLFG